MWLSYGKGVNKAFYASDIKAKAIENNSIGIISFASQNPSPAFNFLHGCMPSLFITSFALKSSQLP